MIYRSRAAPSGRCVVPLLGSAGCLRPATEEVRHVISLPCHTTTTMTETIRPDAGAIEGMVYAIPASILFFWLPLAILLL